MRSASSPDVGEPVASTRRLNLRRLIRGALAALVLIWLGIAVSSQWDEIVDSLSQLRTGPVVLAFVLVVLGLLAAMMSWREVLSGLGSQLPIPVAARIYLLSQLGKYLPGSLWPAVAQVELAHDHAVPRFRSAVASVAVLVVGLTVGALLAVSGLAFASPDALRSYWFALLVIPVGLALLHPRVLETVLQWALRLARRPSGEVHVSGAAILRASIWSAVMWLLFGVHVWLLAIELGAEHDRLFVLAVGAYAAAWVVGFLVVFAPAGAGAREAVLVVALAPALERPEALALALASRALMLAGDLVTAVGAIASARVHERRAGRSLDPHLLAEMASPEE